MGKGGIGISLAVWAASQTVWRAAGAVEAAEGGSLGAIIVCPEL